MAWPGCPAGPDASAVVRCRSVIGSGSGARSATTRQPAPHRSTRRSPPSTGSIGSNTWLRLRPPGHARRWSTSTVPQRHGGVKTAAPRMTPRADRRRPHGRRRGTGRGEAPRDRLVALPPDHRHGRDLPARPDPRRLSRPHRVTRRALLGPDQADVQPYLGRARTSICRGTHRPEGSIALAGSRHGPRPTPQGQPDRRRPDHPLRSCGLLFPAHIEGKPIVESNLLPTPSLSCRLDMIPPGTYSTAHIASRSTTPLKSKSSSNSV